MFEMVVFFVAIAIVALIFVLVIPKISNQTLTKNSDEE